MKKERRGRKYLAKLAREQKAIVAIRRFYVAFKVLYYVCMSMYIFICMAGCLSIKGQKQEF